MGLMGMTTLAFVLLAYWHNVRPHRPRYRQHAEWQPDFLRALAWLGFLLILQLFEGWRGTTSFARPGCGTAFLVITRHCVAAPKPSRAAARGRLACRPAGVEPLRTLAE